MTNLERITCVAGFWVLSAIALIGAAAQPSLTSGFAKQLITLSGVLLALAIASAWPLLGGPRATADYKVAAVVLYALAGLALVGASLCAAIAIDAIRYG